MIFDYKTCIKHIFFDILHIMENNILKSIGADYLLEMYDFKEKSLESIITPDLHNIAKKDVDDNFNEYLKSHDKEEQIKQAGLHYFFAIYLMIILGTPKNVDEPAGIKEKLKEFVVEKNGIKDLLHNLDNFDFYIGACGIEAQNLAQKIN